MDYIKLLSRLPIRKVSNGGVAGVVTTLVISLITNYTTLEVTPEVTGFINTAVMVLVSYITPIEKKELTGAIVK